MINNETIILGFVLLVIFAGLAYSEQIEIMPVGPNNIISVIEFGPDGNELYYLAKKNSVNYGIYSLDYSGHSFKTLLDPKTVSGVENATNLKWGYNDGTGTYIIFVGRNSSGRRDAYRVRIDGSDSQTVLNAGLEVPKVGLYAITNIECMTGSNTLVYINGGIDGAVVEQFSIQKMIFMQIGGKFKRLTVSDLLLDPDYNLPGGGYNPACKFRYAIINPKLSPDGDKILFTRMEWEIPVPYDNPKNMSSLKKADIYILEGINDIVNKVTSPVSEWDDVRLTCVTDLTDNFCWLPSWSPDGSAVFWSEDVSGNFDFRKYCENNDDSGVNADAYSQLLNADFDIYKRDYDTVTGSFAVNSEVVYSEQGVNEYCYVISNNGNREAYIRDDHTSVAIKEAPYGIPPVNHPPSVSNILVNGLPAWGCLTTDYTPVISWTYSDPDEDIQSKYELQISQSSDFYPPYIKYNIVIESADNFYEPEYNLPNGGRWYIRIKVYDSNDSSSGWTDGSDSFIFDNSADNPFDLQVVNVSPDPFNPVNGNVRLNFTINNSANVTIRIFNQNDPPAEQRLLINNQYFTAGMHEVIWDGCDGAGNPVSSGQSGIGAEYDALLYASDDIGQNDTERRNNITAQGMRIFIELRDEPDPFHPPAESVNIYYTLYRQGLAYAWNVAINITDIYGNLIRKFSYFRQEANVEHCQVWDGLDNSGHQVPDGAYIYTITAGYSWGFPAEPVSGIVTLIRNNTETAGCESSDYQSSVDFYSDVSGINVDETLIGETSTFSLQQDGYIQIGSIFDIGPDGTNFENDSAVLVFSYTPLPWINEDKIDLYRYDSINDTWTPLNGFVDKVNNKIYVQVSHLCKFALFMKENEDITEPELEFIPVKVRIKPNIINLNKGFFNVFIKLPHKFKRKSIVEHEIYCGPAKAKKVFVFKKHLIAKFYSSDMEGLPVKTFLPVPVTVKLKDGDLLKGFDFIVLKDKHKTRKTIKKSTHTKSHISKNILF